MWVSLNAENALQFSTIETDKEACIESLSDQPPRPHLTHIYYDGSR